MGLGVRELGTYRRTRGFEPAGRGAGGTLPAAAAALLASLLLTSCGSAADSPTPPPGASSTAAVATPATSPVQPPTPGSTEATVPSQKVTKRKAVKLDGRGEAADGVTVTLTKVSSITAKAVGPGEVAGPALAFTVAVDNGTSQSVDLGAAVVNVTASDGTPASQMTGAPARPFSGSVEAGATASAVYVTTLAKDLRNPVTVEVAVSPADPVVVFRGRATS